MDVLKQKPWQWLYRLFFFFIPLAAHATTSSLNTTPPPPKHIINSISANIAAVNVSTGNGLFQHWLQKQLAIQNNHGINIGGAWLGDVNNLFSGGTQNPKRWTSNSLFLLGMTIDTKQFMNLNGGLLGVQFLQFNGEKTNEQAGTVQGYNSLPGASPLNRSELYQLWYRQKLFDDKFIIRIGKSIPTDEFNNIIRPVPLSQTDLNIPAVSSLLYTPLFVNTTLLGVIPGYYNSAYGITITFTPSKRWYASYGIYDGDGAKGVQTGLHDSPSFDGSYFNIAETGTSWLLGNDNKPGDVAIGAWHQTGKIIGSSQTENGASGFYLFGTQRLWYRHPGEDASGISTFYQYGKNDSDALAMTQYLGGGVTAFGLVPHRDNDSMGAGVSLSWLNHHEFNRSTELMYQGYYQAQVKNFFYLEPAITYIPTPGASKNLPDSWTWTLRAILLF